MATKDQYNPSQEETLRAIYKLLINNKVAHEIVNWVLPENQDQAYSLLINLARGTGTFYWTLETLIMVEYKKDKDGFRSGYNLAKKFAKGYLSEVPVIRNW